MPATQRRTQAQRRAETQQRLYDATLELLAEQGYAATTLSEVVKRAGLSQGALWRHHRTKAELAHAAVSWAEEQVRSAAEPAEVLLGAAPEQLQRAGLELLRAAATDEQLRALIAARSWEQWQTFSSWITAGQDQLDEATARRLRVAALASIALQVFFRDEDIASVLHGDLEAVVHEALGGLA